MVNSRPDILMYHLLVIHINIDGWNLSAFAGYPGGGRGLQNTKTAAAMVVGTYPYIATPLYQTQM